jgi:hypothetical protein
MKKKETIELIKGSFKPDEAREILLQLLNSKINFHNLKNWSSRERFGKPDAYSVERLKNLEQSHKRVQNLFSKSINGEEIITINSIIEINIE